MTSAETMKTGTTPELVRYDVSLLTDDDVYLFNEGSHFRLYEKLGAHPLRRGDLVGTCFAVWAPDAEQVSVIGDFNGWNKSSHPLWARGSSGIWEGFIPGMGKGTSYKYHIVSRHNGYRVDKADPFALYGEVQPKTASIVWDLDYTWGDQEWFSRRSEVNHPEAPMAV